MRLIRVTPPAALPVERETVWAHLRSDLIETDDLPAVLEPEDSAYIDTLIAAVVDRLDGPSGLLNRAMITQTWRATFDYFSSEMAVPLARCQSVGSVSYLGPDGESHTLAPESYRVVGALTDDCSIFPAAGSSWPSTYEGPASVFVEFSSGFGEEAEDIPPSIRHAILEMVARAYAFSEPIVSTSVATIPGSAASAVLDWRVY